uniref:Myb/SANT-like domain-containing protein n=1 Tax=Oryza rufipogon TaxID=4529 RepID=A0A0E0QRJ1_ORYRU
MADGCLPVARPVAVSPSPTRRRPTPRRSHLCSTLLEDTPARRRPTLLRCLCHCSSRFERMGDKADWGDDFIRHLFDVCKEEIEAGNIPMGIFTTTGWKNVVFKFAEKSGDKRTKKNN